MTSISRFMILLALSCFGFGFCFSQDSLTSFPENKGAIILYLNIQSLQSLVQIFFPILSYFVFKDTSDLIPISNKVGNTFVFDQDSDILKNKNGKCMWYRTYFQNVTFDNFTGFFEEIKFVEENSVTFKLSNLEIQA